LADKYPFYKTRYHTMRFADVACYLLDVIGKGRPTLEFLSSELAGQHPVTENKVNLPENRKIAISYKHSLAEPEFNTL